MSHSRAALIHLRLVGPPARPLPRWKLRILAGLVVAGAMAARLFAWFSVMRALMPIWVHRAPLGARMRPVDKFARVIPFGKRPWPLASQAR